MHEERKDFHCANCQKSFGRKGHLKRHFQNVHEGKKEHDKICKTPTVTKNNSQKPCGSKSQENISKKIYHVLPKPRRGRWIVKLKRTEMVHDVLPKVHEGPKCLACALTFTTLELFLEHALSVHKDNMQNMEEGQGILTCLKCKNVFDFIENFNIHVCIKPEKEYESTFATQENCNQHHLEGHMGNFDSIWQNNFLSLNIYTFFGKPVYISISVL